MDFAKIGLSKEELALVKNADWILTKNGILEKVRLLFAELQVEQGNYMKESGSYLGQEILMGTPKISRGENYEGLPYVVLDQPRIFRKPDIFAIRTFFWWGNFFSITLQLAGTYKEMYWERIVAGYDLLAQQGYALGIHSDPWVHHHREDNYRAVTDYAATDFAVKLRHADFIKLSKRISLEEWNEAGENLGKSFGKLIGLLS